MKYVWIIWKKTKDDVLDEAISSNPSEIHAVCSSREIAAKENKRQHELGIKSWIGKYLIDHRVHWSPDDTDPID